MHVALASTPPLRARGEPPIAPQRAQSHAGGLARVPPFVLFVTPVTSLSPLPPDLLCPCLRKHHWLLLARLVPALLLARLAPAQARREPTVEQSRHHDSMPEAVPLPHRTHLTPMQAGLLVRPALWSSAHLQLGALRQAPLISRHTVLEASPSVPVFKFAVMCLSV